MQNTVKHLLSRGLYLGYSWDIIFAICHILSCNSYISLHENFYEPLAQWQILLAYCIVY